MGGFSGVPGATGQPAESFQGPSIDTLGWTTTTTPKVDYAMGNPGQETSPMEMKPASGDSEKRAIGRSANDINGGKTLFDGGGTG